MDRKEWNKRAHHPLQAYEWGEFREKTLLRPNGLRKGAAFVNVIREGGIQITIHPIPYTPWNVGYLPKGPLPDKKQVEILKKIARENNCIFIKCEPLVEVTQMRGKTVTLKQLGFNEGRPLFTKYNFVMDVRKSEEELLSGMKQKTRYNIKQAEKKGVRVELDNSPEAFERYLELTKETTERQGFYAHGREYHRKMWETLHPAGIAHLLVAKYGRDLPAGRQVITTWVLFKFGDTLYYPYGASSREHREVMANNLVMWEAIRLAKKWGLKYLDMWGALSPSPDTKDPWYGFHKFKEGYGGRHVEYIGTWDYVARPMLYRFYRIAENLRWTLLRLLRK